MLVSSVLSYLFCSGPVFYIFQFGQMGNQTGHGPFFYKEIYQNFLKDGRTKNAGTKDARTKDARTANSG